MEWDFIAKFVMPGLVPGTTSSLHVSKKASMAGTSSAKTRFALFASP
jgi:hypothetical protein